MSQPKHTDESDAVNVLRQLLQHLETRGELRSRVQELLKSGVLTLPAHVSRTLKKSPLIFLNSAFAPIDQIPTPVPPTTISAPKPIAEKKPLPPISDWVAFKKYLVNMIISELDTSYFDRNMLQGHIRELFTQILQENSIDLDKREREKLFEGLLAEIIGLGPLETLLGDASVEEILVLGAKHVHVKRGAGWERTDIQFDDNDHVLRMLDRILAPLHKSKMMGISNPMVTQYLSDASQITAILFEPALNGASFIIRKWKQVPRTAESLIEQGIISREALTFLETAVQARLNIVIAGTDSRSQMVLLNVLGLNIPHEAFIITIEHAVTLQLPHDKVLSLQALGLYDGRQVATLQQLAVHAIAMRPDYLLVDGMNGAEMREMLNSPVPFLATMSSGSPYDTLDKLQTLYMMSDTILTPHVIQRKIVSNIHLLVQLEQMRDGSQRITAISEPTMASDGGSITINPLFTLDKIIPEAALQRVGTPSSRLGKYLSGL